MTSTRTNPEPQTNSDVPLYAGIVAVIFSVIGLILSQMNVSLLTGSGIVWVGAALTIGAVILAWSVPGMRRWIKIVTAMIAVIGLTSGIYVEHQLSNQRHEIQQILQQP